MLNDRNGLRVEVLGVYQLSVTDSLVKTQLEILYPTEMNQAEREQARKQIKEQLESTVLIEVVVNDVDNKFDVADFTQPIEGEDRDNWQAPYLETYLDMSGDQILEEPDLSDTQQLRIAFYMHCWEIGVALRSSYGDTMCPPVQPMPERLAKLVPYEPVD